MKNRYHFKEERREGSRWWLWWLALLVATLIVLSGLSYAGIIGKTVVERTVFENSYQRSEGMKARVVTLEAAITEAEARLRNPGLPESTKADIRAQLAGLRVQLRAARGVQ